MNSREWQIVIRWLGWSMCGLLALATFIYGWFWLPHREPWDEAPRLVKILPKPDVSLAGDDRLQRVEWVDRSQAIVRVPIDVAMKVVLDRLAVREGASARMRDMRASEISTDAGSGRQVFKNRPATE